MSLRTELRWSHLLTGLVVAILSFGLVSAGLIADAADAKPKTSKKKPKKPKKPAKPKLKLLPKTGPSGTDFYYPWNTYSATQYRLPSSPGQLIWKRPAAAPVDLESAGSTSKVLYTTRSVNGSIGLVSGSISVPEGPAPDGGWPVLTYGHGTTGIGDQCAPSWEDFLSGERAPYVSYTDAIQNSWLDSGYAVLRTDYEGLGTRGHHPFLVGKSSGRSILDIVKAGRQAGLSLSDEYVILGHSQGGHAALWAAGQAAEYAPGLELKGTVAYSPAATLDEYANALPGIRQPSSISGLAAMILRGQSLVNPKIKPSEVLSPEALALFDETLWRCLGSLGSEASFGALAPSGLLTEKATDDLSLFTGEFSKALAAEQPAFRTNSPILVPQGLNDQTTPPPFTSTLVNGKVIGGVVRRQGLVQLNGAENVTYLTDSDATHSSILDETQSAVAAWLASRFGLPAG